MATIFKSCPNCGTQQIIVRKRCVSCNYDFNTIESFDGRLSMKNRWQRSPELLAQRIEASDLNRRLRDGLLIEPDTLALIFQQGECKAVVTSGMYNFSKDNQPSPDRPWPWSGVRLDEQASAILVSAAVFVVDIEFDQMQTSEGVPVKADLQLAVQVKDPMRVFQNLMQGQDSISIHEFEDLASSGLLNLIANQVVGATLNEIVDSLSLQQQLDQLINDKSKSLLDTYGLDLIECRSLRLIPQGEAYERLIRERGEQLVISRTVENLVSKYDIVKRGEALKKRRKLDQLEDASDLREAQAIDEHSSRIHDDQRSHDAQTARDAQSSQRADQGRAEKGKQIDHALDAGARIKQSKRKDTIDQAEAEAEVDQIQRGSQGQAFDENMRRKGSKLELAENARRKRIELEDEAQRNRLKRAGIESGQIEQAKDHEARRHLDRIRLLSEVEQSRLAADLKKTEALREFSEDQIAALFAKDSPIVAQALAEKYKAQAASENSVQMRDLYERLLATNSQDRQQTQQLMATMLESMAQMGAGAHDRERQHSSEMKEMSSDTMDRMAHVAGRSVAKPAPAANLKCPRCMSQREDGQMICTNCGFEYAV